MLKRRAYGIERTNTSEMRIFRTQLAFSSKNIRNTNVSHHYPIIESRECEIAPRAGRSCSRQPRRNLHNTADDYFSFLRMAGLYAAETHRADISLHTHD